MSDDHNYVTHDRPSSDITFISDKKLNHKYMTSTVVMCLLNYHLFVCQLDLKYVNADS